MKTVLSPLLLFLAVLNASTQYDIDWFTIDGGSGQSSGGAYTLHGTIGQPDAATSSGGAYTLHGGFWSAFAFVQTAGAPVNTTLGEDVAAWAVTVQADAVNNSLSVIVSGAGNAVVRWVAHVRTVEVRL